MSNNENNNSIIVDNVYKTFNVYLDKANTIKEKLLFLFSRNRKEKREVLYYNGDCVYIAKAAYRKYL